MDTEDARVTLKEAAALVGVSTRTVSRWSAAGLIAVERGPSGSHEPATYSRREVEEVARAWGRPAARGSRSNPALPTG